MTDRRYALGQGTLSEGAAQAGPVLSIRSPETVGIAGGSLVEIKELADLPRIGQAIARRGALGFGMKVIYHNRSRLPAENEAELKATWVDKQSLFRQADHVVLVLPYSPAVHHIVGAAELALMKPTATLVNIARGGIVDEEALIKALTQGRIGAAGLDVFEGEPQVNPGFLPLQNVVLTPHIASATMATRLKMAQLAAQNLIAFFATGKAVTPLNEVAA